MTISNGWHFSSSVIGIIDSRKQDYKVRIDFISMTCAPSLTKIYRLFQTLLDETHKDTQTL